MAASYLMRDPAGAVCERPQFLYMRTAVAIHLYNVPAVLRTYDALSKHLYTHATPTLLNAGTTHPHYSSCFLYQPDTSTFPSLLHTTDSLNRLWIADGGIGLSLQSVPIHRHVVTYPPHLSF